MSEAQTIRNEAKRARGTIEDLLAYAIRHGATIDLSETANLIREHLRNPRAARDRKAIPRCAVAVADLFARHQRSHELLRSN